MEWMPLADSRCEYIESEILQLEAEVFQDKKKFLVRGFVRGRELFSKSYLRKSAAKKRAEDWLKNEVIHAMNELQKLI